MRILLGLGLLAAFIAAYFTASAVAQTINECIATGYDGRVLCWVTPATPAPTATATPTATPTPTPPPTSTPPPTATPPVATATPSPTPTPPAGYAKVACFNVYSQSNRVYENLEVGPCPGRIAIDVYNSTNITFRNLIIRTAQAGIFALDSTNIQVNGNVLVENPQGPWDTTYHASCVQFDKVNGGRIAGVTCRAGLGQPGDLLNVYVSQDIRIEFNDVQGGTHPAGCGIIVDRSGARIYIADNIIADMVNCSIGISAGTDITVIRNRAIDRNGDGHACTYPTGNDVTSCVYVWRPPWYASSACDNIALIDNIVNDPNKYWNGGGCTRVMLSGNNFP